MQLLEMPAEEMDVPRESKKRKFEELHELQKLKSKKENSRTVDARDRRMRSKKENHRLVKELDASFESLKSLKEDLKQDLVPEPSVMKRVDTGYSEAIYYPDLLRVTNVHHQTEAEDVMKFFRDSNIEISDAKIYRRRGVSTGVLPHECSFKLAPENIKQALDMRGSLMHIKKTKGANPVWVKRMQKSYLILYVQIERTPGVPIGTRDMLLECMEEHMSTFGNVLSTFVKQNQRSYGYVLLCRKTGMINEYSEFTKKVLREKGFSCETSEGYRVFMRRASLNPELFNEGGLGVTDAILRNESQ